jgi:hypothetical protein
MRGLFNNGIRWAAPNDGASASSADAAAATERVLSGQAWRDFCMKLADAGEVILRTDGPGTPLDKTEGFRYLSRLIRIGLIQYLEAADTDFPYFYRSCDEVTKWGADNPDNIYWNARVRGDRDYRITGTRGTIHYFGIGAKALYLEKKNGTALSGGELQGTNMIIGPDGKFEIIASAKKHPGNWLPMDADTNMLIIRQTFLDRKTEIPGSFHIEQIGGPTVPAPLDPVFLEAAFKRTAEFVHGTAIRFATPWNAPFQARKNQMLIHDQNFFWSAGGDPTIHYMPAYFDLQPDEAWVIDVMPPEAYFWNLSLYNWWNETLDYVHRPVTINMHTAKRNADGSLTAVIAARDVGVGNWLDTAGHKEGLALFRWLSAKSIPQPKTRVVKLADLEKERAR